MGTPVKRRVVIIQQYNTPYRNELFNEIGDAEGVDLTLLYVGVRGENRKWRDTLRTRFREIQVRCTIRQMDYVTTRVDLDWLDLGRKVIALKPDVVISQLGKVAIFLHYVLFWKKVPIIHWSESTLATERGVNWFNRPYLRMHRHLLKAFLVPGRMAREYLEYCGFATEGRLFYAPNSVDPLYECAPREVERKYADADPLRFLFIGSFVEGKGFHHLKEVCTRLLDAGYPCELHVAGDGPIPPCAGMISHGFVDREGALELYRHCHVFLLPSQFDCNPLALIEAAKMGTVLIASDGVGNHPELVRGNGFLVEANSAGSLYAQCVKALSCTAPELLSMARRSQELARSISHANTAAAFHAAIGSVAGRAA